jgi:hypothetical protein
MGNVTGPTDEDGAPAAAPWFSNIAGSHAAGLRIEHRVVDRSRL